MKIDIITLFPEMYEGPFKHSIVKRAQDKSLLQINLHSLRKWGIGKRKTVDDRPYGGGAGMVLMVEPIYKALKELRKENTKVILLTPQGDKYNQKMAEKLVKNKHLILISGHYEGFDERIRKELIDQEISIGDYVLTGGEIPSMAIVDSLARLIPGVLGKDSSSEIESFSKEGFLEYPQYTHPETFMKHKVPEILLSGNHKKIKEWRDKKAEEKTKKVRPDLLKS